MHINTRRRGVTLDPSVGTSWGRMDDDSPDCDLLIGMSAIASLLPASALSPFCPMNTALL
eukprot:scaffold48048_cov71-Phaeocystis_antarctica.AAC.1